MRTLKLLPKLRQSKRQPNLHKVEDVWRRAAAVVVE